MDVERYPWWHTGVPVTAFRQTYGAPGTDRAFLLHCHSYCEAFWIEKGRCLHTINGQRQVLVPGDLTFIRANDVHTGAGLDELGYTMLNVAFPLGTEARMRRRLGIAPAAWPWWSEAQPRTYHLAPEQLARLTDLVTALPTSDLGPVEQELVLLALVQAARSTQEEHRNADSPAWLRRALLDDDVLAGGVAALVAASGLSAAHVNRTVRKCFGVTATDLLNRRRLDHAARALRLGSGSITTVALDAGFNNLAWFHRAFRARFGCTPRHYRMAVQRPVSSSGVTVALGR